MSNQKIVTETALSALASDIKTALSGKANSNDVYPKSQTYNRTEIDNALNLKADKSELYNVYPTDQESGSIAHITDGANNMPVKSLVSEIVAVESGSGTKAPTNPYTISGFSQGDIPVCGKNFYPIKFGAESVENNGSATHSNDNGTMVINTTSNSNFSGIYVTLNSYITKLLKLFNYKGITEIVISFEAVSNVSGNFAIASGSSTVFTIGTTPQRYYIKPTGTNFTIYGQSIDATLRVSDLQIEINRETPTEYEQYNGNTYTFTFGQTVYGGYFDNKGGEIVTHGMVDLGSLDWTYHAPSGNVSAYFDTYLPADSITGDKNVAFNGISEIYKIIPSKDIGLSGYDENVCALANATRRFITCDTRYTDATSYKNAMNGVMLIYPLATPRATTEGEGNLVITHNVVDLSDITSGGTAGSGYVWYMTLNNPKTVPNTDIAPIVSEKYNAIRYNAVASTVNSIAIRDNGVLYVNNGSNTIQPSGIAVYELATPITLEITSQDIPTLLGENNIYSNTGDVEVDYHADIGLYIDKKISSLAQG